MQNRAAEAYEKRKNEYSGKLEAVKKRSDRVSFLRLLAFITAAALAGFGIYSGRSEYHLAALSPAVAFIFLVFHHMRLTEAIGYLSNMVTINDKGLQRLAWEWDSFPEKGDLYSGPDHPYSMDLNIFGRGSLFQHINATVTYGGEQALASLLSGQTDFASVSERQESTKELSVKLHWRQRFQATGMGDESEKVNPAGLLAWAKDRQDRLKYPDFMMLLPPVTVFMFILYYFGSLPLQVPLLLLAVQFIIVLITGKKIHKHFDATELAAGRLKQYAALLKCIEREPFDSSRLRRLQENLTGGTIPASRQVRKLAGIVELSQFRYTQPVVYFPVNILLLWDLFTYRKLAQWKLTSGTCVESWLDAISEFEVNSSLAGLAYENPNWAYPEVVPKPPAFRASAMGHPLIKPDNRVCNDVRMPSSGTALIITGSNMSGKSTLLRTVGINLVLAYAGSPVCAAELETAFLPVYSKMTVVDDLARGVSTYYAELERIKTIVEAAGTGKPMIYLLDEILKGTNSRDRILGTRAVVRKLTRYPTLGMLTTHDLELAALEDENPDLIKNYHFEDQIENGKIRFDYKLKPGVSTSTNAIALMKIVGIDLDETLLDD